MFIRPRQIRPSRFSSRLRASSRRRREYAATAWSMAVIQATLCVALAVAAVRSWQAVDAHGEGVPLVARLVMPTVFAAAALVAGRSALHRVREARELWFPRSRRRARVEPGGSASGDD